MRTSGSKLRVVLVLFLTVGIWGFILFAALHKQDILDWERLRGYTPPTNVVHLSDGSSMNQYGRHLFYVYHPQLEGREPFNQHCRDDEFTIILGCYVSGQGIYIFEVDDSRLEGVEEVTAAHEMLHAAYERLDDHEKQRINTLLQQAYDNITDERLRQTIKQYEGKDPSSVPNELHSILGTEVSNLSPELETYYKRYFTNRQQVVSLSEKYETTFGERKAQADTLVQQLKSLQSQIDTANTELKSEGKSLQQQYTSLQAQQNSADPATFNRAVDAYNARVRAYNQKVSRVSSWIDAYNELYAQYKKVVVEQQQLQGAIDSRPHALQPNNIF
jgi:uncharacterized protein (DUF3084 family)